MFREFRRPSTVDDAIQLRAANPLSEYMCGGVALNSLWYEKHHLEDKAIIAIDISDLPLGGISLEDDRLSIGANVTLQEIVESSAVPVLLRKAAKQCASRNIRNMASIGGNVALSESCSNICCALLALDACVVVCDRSGETLVPMEEYLAEKAETISRFNGKLITRICVPIPEKNNHCETRKFSRTQNDISLLLTDVSFTYDGELAHSLRIAVGGVANTSVRLHALEQALEGRPLPSRDEIERLAAPLVNPKSDFRGSAEFKRHVTAAIVSWALHQAIASQSEKAVCCGGLQ